MKDSNVTDDTVLVRFLRARNLDIQKAETMLRKSLEWRRSNDIDSIKKFHLPPILIKNFKYYYCGDDYEGRPVLLMPIGKWDGKKIIGMGYKEEAGKFMYKICEILMDKCRAKGITQFQVIVDYNELTFWKIAHYASLETLLRVVINFEANFPETLFKTHFVNGKNKICLVNFKNNYDFLGKYEKNYFVWFFFSSIGILASLEDGEASSRPKNCG